MSSVGPLTIQYLQRCGYSEKQTARFDGGTRLLQDVGLFGDNAYDELELLAKEYGVDFSGFDIQKYFPGNFGREPFVLTFLPSSTWADRVRKRYPPITFDMIESVIANKKWIFD
jgi:hypothetical protein